jgi:hypothetical protein
MRLVVARHLFVRWEGVVEEAEGAERKIVCWRGVLEVLPATSHFIGEASSNTSSSLRSTCTAHSNLTSSFIKAPLLQNNFRLTPSVTLPPLSQPIHSRQHVITQTDITHKFLCCRKTIASLLVVTQGNSKRWRGRYSFTIVAALSLVHINKEACSRDCSWIYSAHWP